MARWAGLGAMAALLLLAFAGTQAAAQETPTNETIIEYLANDDRFTILLDLLDEAGLLQELNGTDAKFTLFAPTNEAINASMSANANSSSVYNLTQLLQYHVVPGEFSRINFTQVAPPGDNIVVVPPVVTPSPGPTPPGNNVTCTCVCPDGTSTSAAFAVAAVAAVGSESGSGSGYADYIEDATTNPTNLTSFALKTLLTLDTLDGQAQRIKALGTSEMSVELANNVTVTEPDIQVRNGYIQIIDGVLTPPANVTNVTTESLPRDFSLWAELVERINATDLFTENNSTVLLPIELSFPANRSSSSSSSSSGSGSGSDEEGNETDDNKERVQALISKYNDSEWRDILEFMVIPSAVLYTDELAAMLNVSANGTSSSSNDSTNATNAAALDFTTAADTSLNISIATSGDAYNLTTEDGQTALIVRDARLFDVPASTGVIHVISRVLLPADLAAKQRPSSALDRLLIANNATDFARALNSTGVAALIAGGNYTLFAPTDAAFAAFNNTNNASLTDIVDVHVVPGEPAVVNGAELKPLEPNATLLINKDQAAFTVRVLEVPDAFAFILQNVTSPAYQIFIIDRVLEPPQ